MKWFAGFRECILSPQTISGQTEKLMEIQNNSKEIIMDSKPSKKLVKSAAVLFLTAVLAAMPVSADGYAIADSSCAIAVADSTNVV